MKFNYENRIFVSVNNTTNGEVTSETTFYYHQNGETVWAEYSGGMIVRGHLIAICDRDGVLDMRYQHVNSNGEIMTGICHSEPKMLPDGRIRLLEKWQWTCGDQSCGESIIEEILL